MQRNSILSNIRMTTGESIALEIQFDLTIELLPRVKLEGREERSLNNDSFLGEYKYSSLALDREERRDEKKRLDHLKQNQTIRKRIRLVKHGLEECEFENTCNNDKNLSKIQLEHEREDEMVVVVHECRMVVKETEDVLLEEMEKFRWWFEQDIDGENEDDNKNKLVMVNEKGWMS
ncbi:hypothetical protein Tco_0534055 [Tanacetum coccineum]